MEVRIELIRDILHLLPEKYDFQGIKFTKVGPSGVPATPATPAPVGLQQLPAISVPPPAPQTGGVLSNAAPTSPVVSSYVN